MTQARSLSVGARCSRTTAASSGCRCTRTSRAATGNAAMASRMMPMICVGSVLSSRRTICCARAMARVSNSRSTSLSNASKGLARSKNIPARRSTWARTSARPASRPSASPCAKASLCASACKSASAPTVAILCAPGGLPMSGAFHSCAAAAGFAVGSDKFAAALAAEIDGAFLGQALCNDDDFLLCRLDVRELHRTACFHVVLEDFRRALRHVLQDLLLYFGFGAAQGHRQRVGTHFAQQRLNAAVVDIQQVVEYEQQILDFLVHLAVGFFNLAELLAARVALHGIQDIGDRARAAGI